MTGRARVSTDFRMSDTREAMGAYPSRLSIKAASGVLAVLRGSMYTRAYLRRSAYPLARDRSERVKRSLVCTYRLFAYCGLDRGMARLGAPGWVGEMSGLSEQPANCNDLVCGSPCGVVRYDEVASQYVTNRTEAMPG